MCAINGQVLYRTLSIPELQSSHLKEYLMILYLCEKPGDDLALYQKQKSELIQGK